MDKRFTAAQLLNGAWTISDRQAPRYKMPAQAVSLNLSQAGANQIADILNTEWEAFLRETTFRPQL